MNLALVPAGALTLTVVAALKTAVVPELRFAISTFWVLYIIAGIIIGALLLIVPSLLAKRGAAAQIFLGTAWAASGLFLGLQFGRLGALLGTIVALVLWGAIAVIHRRQAARAL